MRFPRSWPKLLKPRLSLRAALILMTLVGFSLVAPTWKIRQARRQQEQIQQLKRQGMVEVYYDFEVDEDLEFDWESDQTAANWLSAYVGEKAFHDVVRIDDARGRTEEPGSFAYLREFPAVRALTLSNNRRNIHLAPLRAVDRLERLQVQCDELDDHDLTHIAALPRLHTLVLIGSARATNRTPGAGVTKQGIEQLAQMQSLRSLVLVGVGVGDEELQTLCELSGLEQLEVRNKPAEGISDAGLARMSQLKSLRRLSLADYASVTGAGVRCLEGLHELSHLDLSGTQVGGEGMQSLRKLQNLKTLNLANSAIRDDDLRWIADLPKLESLRIGQTQITAAGLKHIARISSLKELHIQSTEVNDQAVVDLRMQLRNLQVTR